MELLDGAGDDPLADLEQRIRKAAELIPRLREERDAAVREKEEAVRFAEEARAKLADLAREIEALKQERQQVRARIEKLLGHLDVLS